ncbi:Acyl-coenzyme A thioesterase PaaI [Sporomusa ovata DSM 2662]|uniref:Phenylacetic acid degradation protein PaaD, thioesterase n=1 Tax=Sporomusa ovata TaxID=2378 RepID=A0A0U1KU31_9FIRM|nr:PaaI family thioesterase [Sporomusa ovata]EQB26842.1 putative esterase [Sporomusa ovata DSM 2662]CQR70942.1 Phenylacetic acid degradation protein PaaD, thioesterase [Sporomusa ovata]
MEKVKQFFSTTDQFAKHVGLELVEAEKGYARVKMAIQPYHLNGVQTVHGGAIFTLADFTLAIASNSHGRVAMGVNATISYMKAVSTGTLFAEAQEVSLNHKLGHYLVNIYNEQHELIAAFQGMVYRKKAQLTFED